MTTTPVSSPATALVPDGEWQARATRAERQLEAIYGPESVFEWRTEGVPLPEVRVDPPGTITFDARMEVPRFTRDKEQTRLVVVVSTPLRNSPVSDIADLSQPGTAGITLKILPRATQLGLPLGAETSELSLEPDLDEDAGVDRTVPLETGVSDKTLEVRLLSLGSSSRSLPEDWQSWSQERKDLVAQWALAMVLQASDNDVEIPPAPEGLGRWYWGPGYVDENGSLEAERLKPADRPDDTGLPRRRGRANKNGTVDGDTGS